MRRTALLLRNSRPLFPLARNFGQQSFSELGSVGVGKLNHVAIAVPNLEEASSMYRDVMGARVSQPADLPEHGVTTVFVELDNTKLELLYPLGENSPIKNFLDKKPSGGIHHICLEVEDIHHAIGVLQNKGMKLIDKEPKIGAHGKPVVFLHPKSVQGVLLELEQV
eukprot:CAMPEP_0174253240 /NCGR_PEP_ID=MMETSP0439-20130205/2617_1 /TAXON_ID=0 /ORGANISM="Stereomyxa ramosa, Strain Chinc5" /LENGTH=165 /DNA_ID=CAMNT_0015334159 /DNA_START=25 /DNA_END=522 /DNA_ORIENTATION=-